jgi:hypothetical protein
LSKLKLFNEGGGAWRKKDTAGVLFFGCFFAASRFGEPLQSWGLLLGVRAVCSVLVVAVARSWETFIQCLSFTVKFVF